MDFVKKNYDKIILSAVLLGVVGFLVFLPFVIAHDQAELKDKADNVTSPRVQPLPPVDLMQESNATERVQSPASFDFSSTNRLFNPLEWKRAADGSLFPIRSGKEMGAGAVVVTRITPLYFVLSLDSVVTNGISPRYVVGVEHQAAFNPAMRRKQQRYVSLDDPKKDAFTLVQVKGAPDNPDSLVLKLADTGETVEISRDKPYQRPEAYAADLRYDPEKKNFPGRRVGSYVSLSTGDYIVVAIDENEVVLFDQSNQKKTTLRYAP
jgi:hypothetical protein